MDGFDRVMNLVVFNWFAHHATHFQPRGFLQRSQRHRTNDPLADLLVAHQQERLARNGQDHLDGVGVAQCRVSVWLAEILG
jgi:hypothetical protein